MTQNKKAEKQKEGKGQERKHTFSTRTRAELESDDRQAHALATIGRVQTG